MVCSWQTQFLMTICRICRKLLKLPKSLPCEIVCQKHNPTALFAIFRDIRVMGTQKSDCHFFEEPIFSLNLYFFCMETTYCASQITWSGLLRSYVRSALVPPIINFFETPIFSRKKLWAVRPWCAHYFFSRPWPLYP